MPVVAATGEDIAVTRELVADSLARDIARKLPALELSAQDIERLSETVMQVRGHQLRLRQLAHTRENAAAIQHTQAQLMAALQTFRDVTGMSAVDLTNALSDEGLTSEEQDHAEPVYEPLPAPAR